MREGLWGERVQGEGRRSRRAKPGPPRLRRGECAPAGRTAAPPVPAFCRGLRRGRGPAVGGRGPCVLQGFAEGRLPPRPAPAAGLPVNRGLDYRRRRGYNRGEVKMMNDHYLMISFENTHSAIRTERLLEQHFKVATMPTLRTVTQSCGISLRLAAEDYEPARKMVAESGLSPQMYAIYLVDSNKNVLELSK